MELLGALAGILTLLTYVPQALKTLKSRQTDDLSLGTYVLLAISAFLWVAYGLWHRLPSVWITNSVVGMLGLSILSVKLLNKSQ